MKRKFLVLFIMCLIVSLFVACGDETGSSDPTASPKPTTAATAGTSPTATTEPTPTPEPTPVPTENPYAVDAIITRFDEHGEEMCTSSDAAEVYIDGNDPFITVESGSGDIWFMVNFDESVDTTEYQYIAVKYRLGYGKEIGAGQHFYAVTTNGGPTPEAGWWSHQDLVVNGVKDAEWHTLVLKVSDAFPNAYSEWNGIRMPGVTDAEGKLYIAWVGAFLSEEDVTKFDTDYNSIHDGKLVADTAPTEKNESVLETEDAFTEVTIDFEDYTAGTSIEMAGLDSDWLVGIGQKQSTILGVDDGVALNLKFDAVSWLERVANGKAYSLTLDVQNKGGGENFSGFMLNYGEERNAGKFFETNGLRGDAQGSLVGMSGIGIYFKGANKIEVYVITYDETAKGISFISYEVETTLDFKTAPVSVIVSDDGNGNIYLIAGGQLIATVTYANDGLLPVDVTSYCERYYRTAKILAADGTEKASTDAALISYTKSFAFGARAQDLVIDNLVISNTAKQP